MTNEDGTLSFGTAIDMSGFDEGTAQIEQKVGELGSKAEGMSAQIHEMLTNVPHVNIDIITNASQSLAEIDAGFNEIDKVVDTNKAAINQLEAEYKRLGKLAGEYFMQGDDKTAKALQDEQRAIKANIKLRKQIVDESAKTADALAETERKLKEEAAAAEQASGSTMSLRKRLRMLREQLVQMEADGQRGTAAYRQLQEEAGALTDAWGDATNQANILAHDQRGMQGILSGLSGLSGAFLAAQGTVSMFVGENEDLQKIMVKIQSLMSITMGLQQVQQTLDKDSAFKLVTLAGIKEWYNKLLAVGRGEQIADTAATAASTVATAANATSTTANAAAKKAQSVATGEASVATAANTVGQAANTTAAVAGTAANIGLAGAFRMVGAAIKSIPVFGWIVAAISAIIAVVSHFISKANEADEELKEQQELLKEGRKAYINAAMEIDNYRTKIETFNGTKREEKALVDELNSKYGSAMGYYNSLSQWKDVLKQKGEAYCNMLLKEAEAQALLTKVTEAYIHLQEVKDKAANGDYDTKWYNPLTWFGDNAQEATQKAQDELTKWQDKYKDVMKDVQDIKSSSSLGGFIAPSATSKSGKSGSSFDPAKAALEQKKAIDDYNEAVKKYLSDAQKEQNALIIEGQKDGLVKELNTIRQSTQQKLDAWEDQLKQLAEVRKNALKTVYMSKNGATEVGWANSDAGKKSIEQYKQELLEDENLSKEYYAVRAQIIANGEAQLAAVRQKYDDALIEQFGNKRQKEELLLRQWYEKMKNIPPEYLDEAIRQMDEAFSQIDSEDFKNMIDWESVFGNLENQSIQSIALNLERVKQYFAANKDSMSGTEIKDFEDAIKKAEDEIAARNPFTALHKSLKDIAAAKDEWVAALAEMNETQAALTLAQQEYNDALAAKNDLIEQIDSGKLPQDAKELTDADNALTAATDKLAKAQENNAKAENRVVSARNGITTSYKRFATNLKSVGGVISDVGGKAKKLASVFSDNVADSIGKAIDFTTEVLDATSDVISAIGDVGKGVAKGVEGAVSATAAGTTSAAAAGATAISTIEKASVILAVISAALQVATAIANLFNNDDQKQKEIEALQERIDQLQWELDNQDAMRLESKMGNAYERLKQTLKETTEEVLKLHSTSDEYGNTWSRWLKSLTYQSEIYQKSVEKIAEAYGSVAYTADKALGEAKYSTAREQLENLAQQQLLIQQQINKEASKKKSDASAIADWRRDITEIAEEMASLINEMLEEIIGYTAEDLASELGDAFIEAAKTGEDAMEAWHEKVNEIVADVLKRMLVQKYLEERIGSYLRQIQNEVVTAQMAMSTTLRRSSKVWAISPTT